MTPGRNAHLRVAALVGGLAAVTLGLSFAAAPFYFAFCRATGFGGVTQVAEHAAGWRGQHTVRVRFNANVAPGLDWTFEPETEAVDVRSGATTTVFFRFRNNADHAASAHAVYNVTPEISGQWFDKISCFCFTDQRLEAHETAEMPVVFFLDPRLEGDRDMDVVHEITLSYTLFAPPGGEKPIALAPRAEGSAPRL